ncbi:angiogenic factor with G patch and FHA domains 1 isoform X2 [Mustelus asterias]
MATTDGDLHSDPDSELQYLRQKVKNLQEELTSCKSQIHTLQKELNRTECYNEDLQKQVKDLNEKIHEREKDTVDAGVQTYLCTSHHYKDYYHNEAQDFHYHLNSDQNGRSDVSSLQIHGACGKDQDLIRASTPFQTQAHTASYTEQAQTGSHQYTEQAQTDNHQYTEQAQTDNHQYTEQAQTDNHPYTEQAQTDNHQYTGQAQTDSHHYTGQAQTDNHQYTEQAQTDNHQYTEQAQTDNHQYTGYPEKSDGCVDYNTENAEDLENTSLADSLRATAEAAMSQTGFTYDESSGLYYDYSTGFYYDSTNQLYYDPNTGIYYYYDAESGLYQFHSRVDLLAYCTTDTTKKVKKKRKGVEKLASKEEKKVLQMTESVAKLKISSLGWSESATGQLWPPCIRVIVVRSPVLEPGTLFIITAVKSATIGREKDMGHAIRIAEIGVSKFHAEVYFDQDLQEYMLVDQGSQNGTVVNGNRILMPKNKCDPHRLEHGDEVKFGETVLSFHIHPGTDTCNGCEPGQVKAHMRLNKKEVFTAVPVLSKQDKDKLRRQELKQIQVKYGLQNSTYEGEEALKNSVYKDRAAKRRQVVGSDGIYRRDDAPASVNVEICDSNKGRKMMEKMGWKKGEGLGKESCGITEPIQVQLLQSQAGLGATAPISIEDVQMFRSKKHKNWAKARERFAETFQQTTQQKAEVKTSWVKGENVKEQTEDSATS